MKVKRRRLSVLEFGRTYAGNGKYLFNSDVCRCVKEKETVQFFVRFSKMAACVAPNIIWFSHNNTDGEALIYYHVKYVDVIEFPEQGRAYFKIVCAGDIGDVEHLVILEK